MAKRTKEKIPDVPIEQRHLSDLRWLLTSRQEYHGKPPQIDYIEEELAKWGSAIGELEWILFRLGDIRAPESLSLDSLDGIVNRLVKIVGGGHRDAVRLPLERVKELLRAELDAALSEAANATRSRAGWKDVTQLCEAFGIPELQKDNFRTALRREKAKLPKGEWMENATPGARKSKYLYLAESPQIRKLAERYRL